MKEEIVSGIKNGLERGESLDEAMQTFINAGYKSVEVREAANALTGGTTPIMNPEASLISSVSSPSSTASSSGASTSSSSSVQSPVVIPIVVPTLQKLPGGDSNKKKIILLVVLLLVLVGILISSILYKDKILSAFS
ncbi:MAG: hypothetical protein AABY00_03665 [Nanoarchaeota archaeon]